MGPFFLDVEGGGAAFLCAMAGLPRTRAYRRPRWVLGYLALAVAASCTPPPQRKPIEMMPIGTVPDIPRTVEDLGPGDTTTPNSGTPSAATGECTVGDGEDLESAFKGCETSMPKKSELPSNLKDKLELRVSSSTPAITGGGQVDLTVFLQNKSKESLSLFFSGDPEPQFDVEALDAKGRRVDQPAGRQPPYPKGYTPPSREAKAVRVSLKAGATVRVKLPWVASKMKWAPDKLKEWEGRGYPKAPAGDLPRGKYVLRVVVPIIGAVEKGELTLPKVKVEVTK